MTTFSYSTFGFIFDDDDERVLDVFPVEIEIVTSGGQGGFLFDRVGTYNDGSPAVLPRADGFQAIRVNGETLDVNDGSDGDDVYDLSLVELTFEGGTAFLLDIYFEEDDDMVRETVLQLGGDPLPDITSVQQFSDLLATAEPRPLTSGPFQAGTRLDLTSFTDFTGRTEADVLYGTDTDDVLVPGLGGDLFVMDLDGTDVVDGGQGSDTLAVLDGDDDYVIDFDAGTISDDDDGDDITFRNVEVVAIGLDADLDFDDDDDIVTVRGSAAADTLALADLDVQLDYDGGAGRDVLDLTGLGGAVPGFGDGLSRTAFEDRFAVAGTDTGVEISRLDTDGVVATLTSVEQIDFTDGSIDLSGLATPEPEPNPGITVTDTGAATEIPGSAADDTLNGRGGDDTISGLGGQDSILGGIGFDSLLGGGGNDTIDGLDGYDTILGGDGRDVLFGSAGNDEVQGGSGNDLINGGIGFDTLFGNDGDDRIDGLDGYDVLYAGIGNDTLNGNAGNDVLNGGTGRSQLNGGIGFDVLSGGSGSEVLNGGDGFDTLTGAGGDDVLNGNAGDDRLAGGRGSDVLFGGLGRDTFVFGIGDGQDRIRDLGLVDTAEIAADLLDAETGLGDYGTMVDGNFALDFGDGDVLVFQGAVTLAEVAGSIDLV